MDYTPPTPYTTLTPSKRLSFYRAKVYTERGWKSVTVSVCKCSAHKFRPFCVRPHSAVCYPLYDYRLTSEITEAEYRADE